MKKQLLTIALAAITITGVKALPTYNDGDVFLGIRDKTASTSYVLDLGTMDQFINAYNGSYNLNLNVGFTAAQLAADLTSNIGANWYSSPTVVMGLFGGFQAGSSYSSIANMPDNALIIGKLTGGAIGNIADQTIGGLTGYAAGIGSNNQGSSQNVVNAWVAANSTTGSWASYQYGGPANVNNNNGSLAYNYYPGTLETQVANSLYVNSVYSSDSSFNNGFSGSKLGTLSVGSNGSVNFNAVPEPSTYALMAFGALLLIIAYRRKVNS